jgi:hypothetical protein
LTSARTATVIVPAEILLTEPAAETRRAIPPIDAAVADNAGNSFSADNGSLKAIVIRELLPDLANDVSCRSIPGITVVSAQQRVYVA